MIPNMPIHLNRQLNENLSYDAQKELLPVIGGPDAKDHSSKRWDAAQRERIFWEWICICTIAFPVRSTE